MDELALLKPEPVSIAARGVNSDRPPDRTGDDHILGPFDER